MTGAVASLLLRDFYKVHATVVLVAALRRRWSKDVFLPALTYASLFAPVAAVCCAVLAGDCQAADAVSDGAALVYADVVVLQKRYRLSLLLCSESVQQDCQMSCL